MPKPVKPPPPRLGVELAPPARPERARELARPGRASRVGMSLYERVIWGLHGAYKVTLSPWIGRQCRFTPTCSDYAAEALTLHGPWRGGVLAAKRLCRCHPWGGHGFDPPPPRP